MNLEEVKAVVAEVLKRTMEGELKWELSEAESYRNQMYRWQALSGSAPRKSRKIKIIRKKVEILRRKIRVLSHENAKIFHTDIIIKTENDYGIDIQELPMRIVIRILKEGTTIDICRKGWMDYEYKREYTIPKFHVHGTATSSKIPSLNTFPFLLRNPDTTVFHKESRHVQEDL